MNHYAELVSDDAIVGRFLTNYHRIWQRQFPNLIKRAHWHVIFAARRSPDQGVSCRSLHRTLYGAYGTDIRTCIERIKDCEKDGFVHSLDAGGKPCAASAGGFIAPTERLRASFDRHGCDTIAEVTAIFAEAAADPPLADQSPADPCTDDAIAAIFAFFGAYDGLWRAASDTVVRGKGLTIAHVDDAMNHLVTYQYWAIVMLLWSAGAAAPPMIVDEVNSKMWDTLRLGHLAIKERVDNLIRWGFFAEHTVKKHKAVSLTPKAAVAMADSLARTLPVLRDLHRDLVPMPAVGLAATIA